MSSSSAETVLFLVLLQQSVSAFPTGSEHTAAPSALKQCQLDPSAPECRSGLRHPEPTSAPSEPSSTTSVTWSQMPATPSETASSATALEDSWSSADYQPPPEPQSLVEMAQRSLSGRVLLFLYRIISRSGILNHIQSVARRRKNDYWPMLIGMFTVGGTLLTAGMAALAAMSGKALMSSMLALGMSLMSALRAPARRCRRSVGTGRTGDCSGSLTSNYELLEQPYPGYVRSFLDVPLDNGAAGATHPAVPPTTDPAATWINYRVPDNAADNVAWTTNVVGMRSPARTMNITAGLGTWGPAPPATGPATGAPDASMSFANQPRELTYSSSYSTIKTAHE